MTAELLFKLGHARRLIQDRMADDQEILAAIIEAMAMIPTPPTPTGLHQAASPTASMQLPQAEIEKIAAGADPEEVRAQFNPFLHAKNCPSHDGGDCTCR